ncbi:MAG: pseudouridine synthase [Rhodobacteraceae bacterium]|nr:pseudouridine synthase [Paracoccaceae bacterium]
MAADDTSPATERIAKVIARSGVASRRDAEKMVLAGRVAVNGKAILSPALDVGPKDRVTIDGKPIDAPQETRVWLYYKPLGLVTTEKDEQGRRTIFDEMPEGMPRVLNVGRLDLNSEGLLLLTNDGGLKRRLELPETGWLRKYRVRVNGRPNDATFDPLRRGITIEGDEFQPMEVTLDRQQGANAWLTVGIREGKNREIRRAMAAVGLVVNRLIRVSYGPFRLNTMKPGDVVEVKRRILRDQLGGLFDGDSDGAESRPARKPYAQRGEGDRKPFARREDGERRPYARREDGERKPYAKREDGDRKPYARREDGERKPYAKREDGDRKPYARREDGDRKPYAKRAGGDDRKPRWSDKGKPQARAEGFRSHADRDDRDGAGRPAGGKPRATGKPAPSGARGKPEGGGKPGAKPFGKSAGYRSHGGKPGDGAGGRSAGFKSHRGKDGGAGKPGGRPKPRSSE